MSTIFAFVKLFENNDHAQAFVSGKLFMNTIRSFKEYKDEAGELRGDEYEGIVALFIFITISLGAFLMIWGIRYLENKENMATP